MTIDQTTPTRTFPAEVVTNASVEYVDLPLDVGRFALLSLDNGSDTGRPNTIGPGGLAALDAALDRIELGQVVGVGITGRHSFAAGADLGAIGAITTRDQALTLGRAGHQVYRRLGALGVPTFAFLNAAAFGGGLELGLHCTYRSISAAVTAVGLPECSLGLIPGWGGTQLLPDLVGVDGAVTVVVENPLNQNRLLTAKQSLDLGLADVMFAPADFLEQSLAWAAQVINGDMAVVRRDVDRSQTTWDAAVARGKVLADGKVHGAAPAPYRALDLIALSRTAGRDTGFTAEDEALADLAVTDELRAGLYSFNLVQKRAKNPAGAPDRSLARPVTKIGIVGAGLMASQLALLFARQLDVPVVMTDLDQARLDRGIGYVHGEIDKLLAKNRLSAERAGRLKALVAGSLTMDAFADARFVIEAVFEEMSVKQKVFADLEAAVAADCVLATNTSSLSVAEMAAKLDHPERVVGFHFFNPVAVMPLLEIIRGDDTDDAALATAFAVAGMLRKTAVLVSDAPGFVVNRLLIRFLCEILQTIDEGTPFEVADSAMDPVGLPMSPLALLQLVGPAVALHVMESLHAAFPERFHVSENLSRMVAAGKTTLLLRQGGRPRPDPDVVAMFEVGDHPSTAERVRQRTLAALAREARLMLDQGVVAQPQDIDLCMITGAGWPFHTGGITPYLDRSGIADEVTGRRFLAPGVAGMPAPTTSTSEQGAAR